MKGANRGGILAASADGEVQDVSEDGIIRLRLLPARQDGLGFGASGSGNFFDDGTMWRISGRLERAFFSSGSYWVIT